jgi:hypothetical protein
MSAASILISLILSLGVQCVRYGITIFFEARKFRRPDIRDKEGVRLYLVNLLGWAAYLHNLFLNDLKTVGFTVAVLAQICKPGEVWDAFYDAIVHDFGVSAEFPPKKFEPVPEPEPEKRRRRLNRFCRTLRTRAIIQINESEITDSERGAAEEYLSFARYLLDHPAVWNQTQSIYAAVHSA